MCLGQLAAHYFLMLRRMPTAAAALKRAWLVRDLSSGQGCFILAPSLHFLACSKCSKSKEGMMASKLNGLRVAILADNGFEQVEMTEPRKALQEAGAQVQLVSPEEKSVKGWNHTDWGDEFLVEVSLKHANADEYDALMLPGGVMNPDRLRWNPDAIRFVKEFVTRRKPIAAICHGPWTLIEVGAVAGHRVTSWPSLKTDLINAGAHWVDEEAVRDDLILTSRKPDDLPVFNERMLDLFAEHIPAAKGIVGSY